MSNGFIHSVRVPRLYKTTAKIVQSVRENGSSLKSLIYEKKHPNLSGIYSLTVNTLQKGEILDYLIRSTRILINEPRLDPWLARALITELIWGKGRLQSESKPVQTVLSYEKQFWELLKNTDDPSVLKPCKAIVKKPRYIRVNTSFLAVDEAISNFTDQGWSPLPRSANYSSYLETLNNLTQPYFIQDFHIPEVLAFPPDVTFHDNCAYQDGQIILQDKASCFPAYFLNPEPGSVVLDMCAAPGMKTSHLAAKIENKGKIYAVEVDERRFGTLCEQMKKTNSYSVTVLNKDALTVDAKQCANVEYILVDPSCSGSGMTDRHLTDLRNEKCPPGRLKSLQSFQAMLLLHALLDFPTVKRVVYSTCSINPEENEEVIDDVFPKLQNAYKLVPIKRLLKDNWINYSSKNYNCSDKCLYAKTETDLCNGFFVAIFERNFDVPLPTSTKRNNVENAKEVEQIDNSAAEGNRSSGKRKKRGKKKHRDEEASVDLQQVEKETFEKSLEIIAEAEELPQTINIESPKKKRKKSKRKAEEEAASNEVQELNESTDIVEVYRKRKKHKCEEDLKVVEVNPSDEENTKKKKKKKKKREGKDTD